MRIPTVTTRGAVVEPNLMYRHHEWQGQVCICNLWLPGRCNWTNLFQQNCGLQECPSPACLCLLHCACSDETMPRTQIWWHAAEPSSYTALQSALAALCDCVCACCQQHFAPSRRHHHAPDGKTCMAVVAADGTTADQPIICICTLSESF